MVAILTKNKQMENINNISTRWRYIAAISIVTLLLLPVLPFIAGKAHAATMARVEVRFDRMTSSTPTTGTVCADPGTTSTDVKTWTVTFPTGYTVSSTASNWQTTNISTTNLAWPSGGTAWPNATSATASISGQTVTWTNASAQTMNTGTLYCYNWTASAALTTKSSATSSNQGSVATQNSSAGEIDSGNYNTATVTNDSISVTASIPQNFSFAIGACSSNTDALGTLSTAGVNSSPTPCTATVATNAKNGWQAWAKDSTSGGGLHSTSANYTVASTTPGTNSTITNAAEGYNMGVTSSHAAGTGTISVAAPFVGGSSGKGGGLDTSLRTVATSNGTASSDVLTLTNNATILASTPAATDYSDTITVVAAGLF
jgi:hypothetical protein